MRETSSAIKEFLKLESAAGVILLLAALVALAVSNSPLVGHYRALLTTPLVLKYGEFGIDKPLLLWINDGLMAVFFFLVGLEIKREVGEGELSDTSQLGLPLAAAIGGILAPAAIYALFNWHDPMAMQGWAIPVATDIAFALGVIALLGPTVSSSLKLFLLTLAIVDDLAAIVIIAVFHTSNLSMLMLILAGVAIIVLIVCNWLEISKPAPYLIVGLALWFCLLKSGVHATLAGVVIALTIPLATRSGETPLRQLEHALHPWVSFGILPIFAFANAGVSFAGMAARVYLGSVPLGIAAGLVLGKQLGVFGTAALVIKTGYARLPAGAGWAGLYGVALLTGIGFTMSLFLGTLAFEDPSQAAPLRVGVLTGSLISALGGYLVLRFAGSEGSAQAAEKGP